MSQPETDFFGDRAGDYRDYIRRIVPQYDESNQVLLEMVPFGANDDLHILDLGAGTGLISALLLEVFPRSRVVALDRSQAMLDQARETLAPYQGRATFIRGPFPETAIGSNYHLIVSSLMLHHLSHDDKRTGYRIIFDALVPGGQMLNRDVVHGETAALTERYAANWRRQVQAQGHDDMSWFDEHLDEDNPATVEAQLAWLSEIGFVDVGCHWRNQGVALFGGRRPRV